MAGEGADAPLDPAGAPPLPAVDADDAARAAAAEEVARAEAAARAARFAAPGLGAGAEDGGGAEALGVGADRVPMGSPPGAGGGGAHGGPDQPGMIERDEAALQALQKMYHDEDYAMDLVKQAADRLGDFQPALLVQMKVQEFSSKRIRYFQKKYLQVCYKLKNVTFYIENHHKTQRIFI